MNYFSFIKITIIIILFIFSSFFVPVISLQNSVRVYTNASNDNNIEWNFIHHNSRDDNYRNPGWGTNKTGAVPVGTDVTLRIHSAKNDLSSAEIKVWDNTKRVNTFIPMAIISSDENYDYWEGKIVSPNDPSDFYYAFRLKDGSAEAWYGDNTVTSIYEDNRVYQTGGKGVVTSTHNSNGDYALVFYDPDFQTPNWHKNAVGYQIFIDRFYNGDTSNDPVGDGESGDVIWWAWDTNGNGVKDANERDLHVYKQDSWDGVPKGGYDYFGGDFQGIMQKVDYLNNLGIDFIWFNPFTSAPDNHGYSVDDYRVISPYYGIVAGRDEYGRVINNYTLSMEFFQNFSSTLKDNDISIFYDVVINHVSAQSVYFQRFERDGLFSPSTGFNTPDRWSDIYGAYENPFLSPYIRWFEFYDYNHNYNSWFGFDHIPTVIFWDKDGDTGALNHFVTGPDNIFDYWMDYGVEGFRLDVNEIYQDGDNSNRVNKAIRDTVKAKNPDAVIIGEIWGRATQWLTGNMNDGTQNMPFRFNTIDWMWGFYSDELYTDLLHTIQENYPREAFESLWVNLGNHDRTRILTALNSNPDKVLVASTLQFGYPGVPVVWYGDEVGVEGLGDPGTRQPYPWGNENTTMLEHYKKLIHLKKSLPVLANGDFEVLPDSASGVITFHRYLEGSENDNALIIGNRDAQAKLYQLNLSGTNIKPGDILTDLLNNNETYVVGSNNQLSIALKAHARMMLFTGISPPVTDPEITSDKPTIGTSTDTIDETTTESNGFRISIFSFRYFFIVFSIILIFKKISSTQRMSHYKN
jgi:glycosidase